MAAPKIALEAASVVIRGQFNPAVFSPSWFLLNGLIGQAEASAAKVDAIAAPVASFKVDWLQIHVQTETLQVLTEKTDAYESLRDVAVGILAALPGTPISQLGINRQVHFAVDNAREWHAVGDSLVRNDFWEDVLILPGMADVTTWGVRPDKYSGFIQVQVQPSARVDFGVFVAYNDHYNLSIVESQPASREEFGSARPTAGEVPLSSEKAAIAVEVLTDQWSESMKRSQRVVQRVAAQRAGA
ncbi:hypothetical protein E1212_02710 [Jiangella ureilytica]|uniref:TIGR04255 family protein n=1 Tax=Jiangella ureilytica TaxID=2530374 RepID=A0A4R4RW92_9ACTN|nr:hypothetical protein [Jiangella ureilytica]TDC54370.1 hypothetical protein E1212_02710 [Jiangella ureilytica]